MMAQKYEESLDECFTLMCLMKNEAFLLQRCSSRVAALHPAGDSTQIRCVHQRFKKAEKPELIMLSGGRTNTQQTVWPSGVTTAIFVMFKHKHAVRTAACQVDYVMSKSMSFSAKGRICISNSRHRFVQRRWMIFIYTARMWEWNKHRNHHKSKTILQHFNLDHCVQAGWGDLYLDIYMEDFEFYWLDWLSLLVGWV